MKLAKLIVSGLLGLGIAVLVSPLSGNSGASAPPRDPELEPIGPSVGPSGDCLGPGSMVCDHKNTTPNCKYCDACCNGCDPRNCNGHYCICS